MLDLSNATLDLKERISRYKRENSPVVFEEPQYLFLSGLVARNSSLKYYLNSFGEDPLEVNLHKLMCDLLKDLKTLNPGFFLGHTSSNHIEICYHPKTTQYPIQNSGFTSIAVSRAVNFISNYYKNPMVLFTAYQVPGLEVQNVFKYSQLSWEARRNRILGEMYLGIPSSDHSLSHKEILSRVLSLGSFKLEDLPVTMLKGLYIN
jgi:hypothetical protein